MPRRRRIDLATKINSVLVAKAELIKLNNASLEHRRSSANQAEDAALFLAAIQARDGEHAQATYFRMAALAQFVTENDKSGWVKPRTDDDGRIINEALFAAAAVHPLIEVEGELRFEQKTFLDRVLALAPPEAHG